MEKTNLRLSDFDSTEEFYGYLYFLELYNKGYVESIKFQVQYPLYAGLTIEVTKQLKTKVKVLTKVLLKPRVYTLDFEVKWTEKAKNTPLITTMMVAKEGCYFHIYPGNSMTSHIEIKGQFDNNNATRYFSSRTQPWMWEKYSIYVQLCKVSAKAGLFKDTFIPEVLLPNFYYKKDVWTKAKPGKPSILKARKGDPKCSWKYKTLQQYLDGN